MAMGGLQGLYPSDVLGCDRRRSLISDSAAIGSFDRR
jgi:hypothetical protein